MKITKNTLLGQGEKQLTLEFTSNDGRCALRIQSAQAGGRLASKLMYREKANSWEALSSLHIDLTDKNHKQAMHARVERQASRLIKRQEYAELDKPERILSQIPKALFDKLSRAEYYDEVAQAVFYHWAIFKSAQRADESKSADCHCGKLDTYLSGESPFFCLEDVVVQADKAYGLFDELSQASDFAGKRFIPEQTLVFLKQRTGTGVSASTIDRIFKAEFRHFWKAELTEGDRNRVLKAIQARSTSPINRRYDPDCIAYHAFWGHDCGCCKNYEDICRNCSAICYLHDRACIDCDHWYCLWGCKPGCPNEEPAP